MKEVTLQFTTLEQLAHFKSQLSEPAFELNIEKLTLFCFCTNNAVQQAVDCFGATVLPEYEAQSTAV